MMMRFVLASILTVMMAGGVCGQTAGQLLIQRKKVSGSGFENLFVTPENGKAVGWSGGTLGMVDFLAADGDGSALTGITAGQVGAVAEGDAPTFGAVTLTDGVINSQTGVLAYNFYDVVDSTAVPYVAVSLYDDQDPPALIGSSLYGFRGDGAGSGYQFFQGSTNNFQFEGVGGANTAVVSASVFSGSFSGSGANLTNLDAGDISTGTLDSARLPTLTAGSETELQRRNGSAFEAVTRSSVSGGAITLGNAEAMGVTSTSLLTLRNTTAAAAGLQQVSPSFVLEGRGWKTDATAGSQTVRFRQNILPVQGAANPTATYRIQSEINNSGSWTDRLTLSTSDGSLACGRWGVINNGNGFTFRVDGLGVFGARGSTGANMHPSYSWGWSSNGGDLGEQQDLSLWRDAANTLAQRNSTASQVYRLYETDSGANDEYLEFSAASGMNVIRPQATGTGTASVVRYHTTPTVWFGSGSGSPEGVHTGGIGSVYTDTANGLLYRKTSGTGSTGWVNP